ncbi:hypothetical protein ABPG75_012076 [Micractinium tetrahymenae]
MSGDRAQIEAELHRVEARLAKLYADSAALQERESALVAAQERLQREERRLFEREILLDQAEAELEARRAALKEALGLVRSGRPAPPSPPRGYDPLAVAFVEDAEAGFSSGFEADEAASEGEDTEAELRAVVQEADSVLAEQAYPRVHE